MYNMSITSCDFGHQHVPNTRVLKRIIMFVFNIQMVPQLRDKITDVHTFDDFNIKTG